MQRTPQRKIGLYTNKQRIGIIVTVSVVVVLALALFVGQTIGKVEEQVTNACFEELTIAAKQLADSDASEYADRAFPICIAVHG